MNPHFHRFDNIGDRIPAHAYGLLDHIEFPAPGSTTALLAFDLVDADWLAAEGAKNALFAIDNPQAQVKAWQKINQLQDQGQLKTSPFEKAPLYRLEIEVPAQSSWFGFPQLPDPSNTQAFASALSKLEGTWFEFNITHASPSNSNANVYATLFAKPTPVIAKGSMPTAKLSKKLSKTFSLTHLPNYSLKQLRDTLSSIGANYLAAYDVGQGNANALLDDNFRGVNTPSIYYDLGAGVYRNRHTTPNDLRFCFSQDPVILLSHWDADHWAGTYATMVDLDYPARKLTWIAPRQKVGPVHVAFAYDVTANGGKFYTCSFRNGTLGRAKLKSGQQIKFMIGTGSDRNGTGLVLAIEDSVHGPSPRSWLLTGDCDYSYFINTLAPLPPVCIVAPHHGATLTTASPVPAPVVPGTYRRIIYSFGAGNSHGKSGVQHPTALGVKIHDSAGWDHGAWSLTNPGTPIPGGDALATCEHSPGKSRGGLLIGWDKAPLAFSSPCGTNCSATLTQV